MEMERLIILLKRFVIMWRMKRGKIIRTEEAPMAALCGEAEGWSA